jgi:hypothetical protein
MLLRPVPQMFNTFNTFNTFAIVTPASDYPTLIHPQAPRAQSVSERADSTLHPSLLSPTGEGVRG